MNNPESYRKNNRFQRQIVSELVTAYLPKFHWHSDGLDTLMDIGSGTGDMVMEVVLPIMAKTMQRIVLSDLNPNMINYAQSQHGNVNNSEFMVFDIGTESKIPDNVRGKFDHVTSFYCLHLLEDQRKAFANVYSLMRPQGADCLLNLFARGPYYDAYLTLSKSDKWASYMQEIDKYTCYWHYAPDPVKEATQILRECGFTAVDVDLQKKSYDFEDVESFKATILAVSHYVHQMPQHLHKAFMDDYVKAIDESNQRHNYTMATDGKYRFHFEQLVIFARREPASGY